MSLVQHNDLYRRTWMFTRNMRRIEPWKIAQVLTLFWEFSNATDWTGQQELQNEFCKALEDAGIKREGTQYDSHSGGPRTYLAQLHSLGLLFKRPDNSLWLTKAGQDIVDGKPPMPILQKMLFKYQYPSVYSRKPNVGIHPDIKVKPFLFILKLLKNPNIDGYLTSEEIIIPVIYGHNHSCYDICIEKILQVRNGTPVHNVLNDKIDCYTRRTRNADKSAIEAIKSIKEDANTCKNYLQACCLIDVTRETRGTEKITINPDMNEIIEDALRDENKFIQLRDDEESFQRAFGCWDSSKDTRNLQRETPKNVNPVSVKSSMILAHFFKYIGQNVVLDLPEEFIQKMVNGFGFDRDFVISIITPHLGDSLSFFESTFIELSKGGVSTATEFEKAICSLFGQKLKFEATHTGPKPRPSGEVGAYADVFVVALDKKHCAIIDAKASPKYNLSSDDYYKMKANYINNYKELTKGRELELEFCSYVAGGFGPGVESKLKALTSETGIKASAISAYELLNVVKNNQLTENQEKIRSDFRKNKILQFRDFAEAS